MKIAQIVNEGGWSSTATQDTTITPSTVRSVLPVVNRFVKDINQWLQQKNIPPMKLGAPLGSTAHYKNDNDDTEYGDIDMQTVAPDMPNKNPAQVGRYYNNLIGQFVDETNPKYLHDDGRKFDGHPVFQVGDDFVQVDFVWSTKKYANWSQYRMTPAHNVKGAVHGSMFSSFGDIMNISIQGSGAQMKIVDNQSAPFGKTRKFDKLETLSSDISNFGVDIVNWMFKQMGGKGKPKLDPLLKANPGLDTKSIKSEQLANVIKGVAKTFVLNNMYGKSNLSEINSEKDFINQFVHHISNKLEKAATSSKFDKAESPTAIAKANAAKEKLRGGIPFVKGLMQG